MAFNPTIKNDSTLRPSYTHQPLTFDHFGTHVRIHTNGKVTISLAATGSETEGESIEYDEVEVSASLIFKIAQQLKLTRSVEFVKKD